jgi:hypothetical protein
LTNGEQTKKLLGPHWIKLTKDVVEQKKGVDAARSLDHPVASQP